ncbi:MAG: hypothetical protein ACTSP0_07095, partial [Alphaproteobacteria bacterium]
IDKAQCHLYAINCIESKQYMQWEFGYESNKPVIKRHSWSPDFLHGYRDINGHTFKIVCARQTFFRHSEGFNHA